MKYLRLIRFPNLVIVALTQYLMRFFIIQPMLAVSGFELQLSEFDFFVLVMATVMLTAGGYVINDYFDARTDFLNKPEMVVIGKKIHRRIAIGLHIVLNIIGIVAGFFVSYKIGMPSLGLVYIMISGILWFYSANYKRQFLIGNFLVAILTALVPIIVFIYELPLLNKEYKTIMLLNRASFNFLLFWGLGYAFFAFITTLTREIIKDVEDFEGDSAYGMNTLPIILGISITKLIIIGLLAITVAAIILVYTKYLLYTSSGLDYITLIYFLVFLIQPLIFVAYKIIVAKTKKDYRLASGVQKYIMLAGILYSLIVKFLIINQFLV